MILATSAWGDVIHYPEFVKLLQFEDVLDKPREKDPDKEHADYVDGEKRALLSSRNGWRRVMKYDGIWRLKKSSYSTSQLRRQ